MTYTAVDGGPIGTPHQQQGLGGYGHIRNNVGGSSSSSGRRRTNMPLFVRRFFKWRENDFEYASWQLLYLVISPKRVYRNIYYHKQTKNQWARDDPALIIIQLGALLVAATAYTLIHGAGFGGLIKTVFQLVIVNYIIFGLMIATLTWYLANRFLHHRNLHTVEQRVEWMYSFDIHCNSFFPLFLVLYVIQFFFLPLLLSSSWLALFFGNSLYIASAAVYIYITYLGYQALPFLQNQEVFLYPLPILAFGYLVSLFGYNICQHVIDFYF